MMYVGFPCIHLIIGGNISVAILWSGCPGNISIKYIYINICKCTRFQSPLPFLGDPLFPHSRVWMWTKMPLHHPWSSLHCSRTPTVPPLSQSLFRDRVFYSDRRLRSANKPCPRASGVRPRIPVETSTRSDENDASSSSIDSIPCTSQ